MIIQRPEEIKRIKSIKKWTLVYGRRKTGKTFLATQFIPYDEYFFIKSDKGILTRDNISITYDTFLELLKKDLSASKTIVIDEFHRLGEDFFDFLHFTKKQGRIILISSTLFLSKKLISGKSALLGLFAEVPISIINLKDTLRSLESLHFSKKETGELAVLITEPKAIDYLDKRSSTRDLASNIILNSIKTIPALIGEIFTEEQREISAVYEGVLRAIASGKVNSGEMSSYLFSKKLIKKDDPSIIQQYLNNLISFGIIRRLLVFNKKRFVYKLTSPLAKLYYYADEKYNFSERKVNEKELKMIIDDIMPKIMEDAIRERLAEKHGLIESVVQGRDYDIDALLLKFKKPEIALEVKWKSLSNEDIKKAEENLSKVDAREKVLFVRDKRGIKSSLKVWDIDELK